MFHNTISANIIRGGDKINVIPSEVTAELDSRTIPGLSREEVLAEIINELREMSKIPHGANERISIEGLKFAIKTLY